MNQVHPPCPAGGQIKAKRPYWNLERVKALAASDLLVLSRTRALNFFEADDKAVATAKHIIAGLSADQFADTLLQPAKCDVYGVQIDGGGWYLKLTIDPQPPEGLIVISLHPLEKPLKTNTGMVKP